MASQRRRKEHHLCLAGHVMIDLMSCFVAASPLPRGGRGTDNKFWFFLGLWFFILGKKDTT